MHFARLPLPGTFGFSFTKFSHSFFPIMHVFCLFLDIFYKENCLQAPLANCIPNSKNCYCDPLVRTRARIQIPSILQNPDVINRWRSLLVGSMTDMLFGRVNPHRNVPQACYANIRSREDLRKIRSGVYPAKIISGNNIEKDGAFIFQKLSRFVCVGYIY